MVSFYFYFFSLYLLDFCLSALINGSWDEWYLSLRFTRPRLFPCCKVICFTAYLIGTIFVYLCNIVMLILRTPLRSLWLFLGLIVGPFMCYTNKLCVLDFMMYNMWPWSINFQLFYPSSLSLCLCYLNQQCMIF